MRKAKHIEKTLILRFIVAAFLISCGSDEKLPFLLPENTQNLIAGDSAKTWKLARRFNNKTRMNMGDCFLSYRACYQIDSTMHDNNGKQDDCGASLTTKWSIYHDDDNYPYMKLKGGNLKELMNLDKDYKFFKILDLNDSLMVLEFRHKQFSSKTSTIVDIFVPENHPVKDRKFHW